MSLAEYLKEVKDIREYRRNMTVKLFLLGHSRESIAHLLSVSKAYISKWRGRCHQHGVEGLSLGYQGSEAYLTACQQQHVLEWIDLSCWVASVTTYLASAYGRLRE